MSIAIIGDELMNDYLEPKEIHKTCGGCKHEGESADIAGSTCYLCKRNPEDHRIDWFEKKKEE